MVATSLNCGEPVERALKPADKSSIKCAGLNKSESSPHATKEWAGRTGVRAVVVAGPVEGLGGQQAQAIRQEHGQGFVDFFGLRRDTRTNDAHPHLPASPRAIGEPERCNCALRLDLDHRCQPLQLWLPRRIRVGQTVPSETQPVRQLRTREHPAAHPSRCTRRRGLGPAHLRHKTLGHQRDRMACEDKRVSLAQGGHKRLLHVAKQSPVP